MSSDGDGRAARIEAALNRRLHSTSGRIQRVGATRNPLSHVQQALWILSELAGEEAVNNRPLQLRLRGPLDRQALGSALSAIVERHAPLRSIFPIVDSEPVQDVGEVGELEVPYVDTSHEPDPVAAARTLARLHVEARFDLATDRPFRPLLIGIGVDDHLLALSMHHIVFDGWSERILINELLAHYDAFVEGSGTPRGLDPLPIEYGDFARWERQRSDSQRLEAQLRYWTDQLADLPPDLRLPPDRELDPEPSMQPVTMRLGEELTTDLRRLAGETGSTPFMVLLATLNVLVARHSGQDDVVVGVPTAGRPLPETESLIGCFINTLAIRTRLDGNPRFIDLLSDVASTVLEGLDHAAVPYSRVYGAIRPWAPDRIPLYRVHFQLRNFPDPLARSDHLDAQVFDPTVGAGNHISIRAIEDGSDITMVFGYDPARFSRSTVDRWAGHFRRLLAALVDDPAGRVMDQPLLGPDERHRVLVEFNAAPLRAPDRNPQLLAERLRQRAVEQPDAPAVEDGVWAEHRRTITSYSELDRMVDRVAGVLVDRGLGPEDRVVLYADRGLPTIAGIMGALRAGVAYVPIDAELTSEWLQSVLVEVGASVVLTRPHLSGRFGPIEAEPVILDDVIAGADRQPVDDRAQPGDLAYVLYTSGSTGPPKGVEVEQRNLAAYVDAITTQQPFRPGDRVVQFHSISFDAVVNNLQLPLSSGATVVIRDEAATSSIPRFIEWLEVQRITHLRCPTSYFQVMADEMILSGIDLPPSLRFISFGGEQVTAEIVNRWHDRYGSRVELFNSYGPTETTVSVTAADLTVPGHRPLDWAPIGAPYPGCAVYVLDERGEPCPIGVEGELHIGGSLVSRGYFNAPDLTESRFLRDPFSQYPGARMFRTGDVGRWLPAGSLEVSGRKDRQVKVRGYRVEPGEVEAALRRIPDVRQAVVLPKPGPDGTLTLHAFIVTEGGRAADVELIRSELASMLPTFMRPSSVSQVEVLPTTVSGKVDGRALLTSVPRRDRPSGSVLEEVAAIWTEVLNVDRVTTDSNFFELGGHSLLAIRVMSRIRDRLDVDLALTVMFENATLGSLVDAVEDARPGRVAEESSSSTPTRSVPADAPDLERLLDEIEQMTDREASELLERLRSEQEQ